jgi:eukaryotic-like serine/threonine-protein kinase
MVCPNCGQATNAGGHCSTCGSIEDATVLATGVLTLDTTGLPPGATRHAPTAITELPTGDLTIALSTPSSAERKNPLHVGQSFGPRYHIIKLLGAGGMGAVYQSWDAELSVAVALKVIRQDSHDPEAEKRFKNELLLARQVTHKNVVRIHDLGEIDGIKYITMPYVKGDDLASTLRRDGKMPVAKALPIARQIAAGLEAAHEAGVVHRDLKPANVMITVTPEDVHAQIMDFGISASNAEAMAGGLIGTLEYMAPEQGSGLPTDARADIYAFGLILYELLSGPRSIVARTSKERFELMQQRIRDGLPSLRSIEPTVTEPLEALVMRCLERDPVARFQTTSELVAALARLDDAGELIPEARKLTKKLVATAGLVVGLLLSGTYYISQWLNTVPKAPDPVSVVIADFENRSQDPAFNRTLEPMVRRALEGASFITAYDRIGVARTLGLEIPERFDATAARLAANKQGLGIVLAGFIEPQGTGYRISMNAIQAIDGKAVAAAQSTASDKNQVLSVATRLVTNVRTALGDSTSESQQEFGMRSLSATSLDVVRHYAAAQDAGANGKFDDARAEALKAIDIDRKFGIGYQMLAVAARNVGNLQESEKYINEALKHVDSMTEREKYTTRGFYYRLTGDYQKCVDEYGQLIKLYEADVIGHNQLALCMTKLRNMKGAVTEMRKTVALLPKRTVFRNNLALYANYAGDFQSAEKEATTVQAQGPDTYATLALAFTQLGLGKYSTVAATYERLATIDDLGASFASLGLGDLASIQGRFGDAVAILRAGVTKELADKYPDRAAAKLMAISQAELSRGNKRAAIAAAREALTHSKAVKIRFLAGRTFVEAGDAAAAAPIAVDLGLEPQAEPQAYAKILNGNIALTTGDPRVAIRVLDEANKLLDTWIGHFDLGRAYLAAKQYPQADSEFDRCLTRRGEALALFLDEEPTYAFLPPVYYYQGLTREGMQTEKFADSYRAYLAIRGGSTEDPLIREVRRRASAN